MGAVLFFLGILGLSIGGLGWAIAYAQSRIPKSESMTDAQRNWYEAESDYRQAIRVAEKGQKNTSRAEEQNVGAAQNALALAKQVGARRISGGSLGPVTLWENRVEVGGTVFTFEDGTLECRADSTLPSKSGSKENPGNAVISVSGSQGSASATLAYNQLKRIQKLASMIEDNSEAWPSVKEEAAQGVEEAAMALGAAQEKKQEETTEASLGVEAAVADRAAIETAREHVPTAFCPKCKSNVAKTDDSCPEGHGELLEYQPDDLKPVRVVARPKRGVRIGQLAVAGGTVLFVLGVALTPPQQATLTDSENTETPKAKQKATTASSSFEIITTTETIPFETERKENGDRKEGERITLSAGSDGIKKVTYKQYEDGRKVIEKEEVLQEPVAEVVEAGTKTQAQFDADAKYAEAISLINQGDFIGANAKLQEAINLAKLPAAKTKQAEIAPQLAVARKDVYKKQCQNIPYNQLEKDADKLVGTKVHYYGEIFTIEEDSGMTVMQVYVTNNGWDIWTDQVIVVFPDAVDVYKDDKVHIWGEVSGSQSYESQAGWNITAPKVMAKYVEK